jgi:kynurenine formamidase
MTGPLPAARAASPETRSDIAPRASRFGRGDQLGALNLLTAAHVVEAARLIRKGAVHSLAVVTDQKTPAYGGRKYEIHVMEPALYGGATWGATKANAIDEFIMAWPGAGTHIDGLGHVGIDHVFYDETPAADVYDFSGLKRFGTHALPPIASRAVLLDIAAYRGVEMLAGGDVVTPADLDGAAARRGVKLRAGDVALIRTGWIKLMRSDPERYLQSAPGLGRAGADYLAQAGVCVIGADQGSTEVFPAEAPDEFAPVHQLNLAINGVYHLQNLDLEGVAGEETAEFFFCLGVPRFFGASQMTCNPIAIC